MPTTKKTIRARCYDALSRWDESANNEIAKREHVATMQGGSAMSAERSGDELKVYHHSASGIPTGALGDHKSLRRDSREMSQRTHIVSFHGANYDAERDDEDGQLKVYKTNVTGVPSKTGLLGDQSNEEAFKLESDTQYYEHLQRLEKEAAQKHAAYITALRAGDPV